MMLMLFKKINKNRWMICALLIGNVLMIALMSSIPMYSRGIITKSIQKRLYDYFITKKAYPGCYTVTKTLNEEDQNSKYNIYSNLNKIIPERIMPEVGLPLLSRKTLLSAENVSLDYDKGKKTNIRIEAVSKIEDHITILNGRIFSREPNEKGEYEVIVSETAMQKLHLVFNKAYQIYDESNNYSVPLKVKIVGVYRYRDVSDPFWIDGNWDYPQSILLDSNLFVKKFISEQGVGIVTKLQWNYFFDYSMVGVGDLARITTVLTKHNSYFQQNYRESNASKNEQARKSNITVNFPVDNILKDFMKTEKNVKTTLLFLQMPIFIIFILYILMASNLVIQQDKNEIALLKSRGAGTFQIVRIYLFESIIIGIIGLIIGPLIGLLLCRIMGASNGFLQFVQRGALKVSLTKNEYLYSIYTIIIFIVTMILPALSASKNSIVIHKQKKFRNSNKSFWEKYYIDFFLLIVSLYSFYSYSTQNSLMLRMTSSTSVPVDPLIYFISGIFTLSLAMMFLRIFPFIINIILRSGISRWSTSSFATLINVGRSGRNNQFFMMFLVLTISIGIFNLSAARTINTNMENSVMYTTGADIVLKPYWDKNKNNSNDDLMFLKYSKMPGVNMATKVFRTNEAECDSGFYIYNDVYLMGVIPHEFGKTAWMQGELLYPHWNWYLNILTTYPNAVLISNNYREKYNLKIGGPVEISLKSGEKFNAVIGGFIDYWPTVDPNNPGSKYFVIANLNYMQKHLLINSYEIWIKTNNQTSIKTIYDEINRRELPIEKIQDINGEIINMKNEPLLQGTNGTLTIGFISIVIMMIIGFMLFWILSIKDRQLEFGILRALGLPLKKIMMILIGENLLTCGISIIAGTIIGKINTGLTIPLIAVASNLSKQALPFKIISKGSDYIRLYSMIGIILVSGLIILIDYVRKIRIDQAVKLGED